MTRPCRRRGEQVQNSEGQLIKIPPARIGLSTSSVYPESTSSAFELARRLGYDGVEIMIGIDPVAADIDAVEKPDYHGVPMLAIHSPCLLITQRVWGTDPLVQAGAIGRGGAQARRGHRRGSSPFRWQRDYARGFVRGVRFGEHVSLALNTRWRAEGIRSRMGSH